VIAESPVVEIGQIGGYHGRRLVFSVVSPLPERLLPVGTGSDEVIFAKQQPAQHLVGLGRVTLERLAQLLCGSGHIAYCERRLRAGHQCPRRRLHAVIVLRAGSSIIG
jgi:hypothetical protein